LDAGCFEPKRISKANCAKKWHSPPSQHRSGKQKVQKKEQQNMWYRPAALKHSVVVWELMNCPLEWQ
jgi:hypothetical protein